MNAPPNALRIAVPRGALLRGTLQLLERIGIDTAEVRSNERRLLRKRNFRRRDPCTFLATP